MHMIKKLLITLLGLLYFSLASANQEVPFHNHFASPDCCLLVSHASGSIEGMPYSNSLEALNANYALNRRVFEVDVILTADKQWALTHDWESWAIMTHQNLDDRPFPTKIYDYFASEPMPPTSQVFINAKINHQYTPLLLTTLLDWMNTHPDTIVVLDSKNNSSALAQQIQAYPALKSRIIFEAFSESDLITLKKHVPTSNIIFATYKTEMSDDALLALLKKQSVTALLLPLKQALRSLSYLRAHLGNLPIYVHGHPKDINSFELRHQLQQLGASGFFLD